MKKKLLMCFVIVLSLGLLFAVDKMEDESNDTPGTATDFSDNSFVGTIGGDASFSDIDCWTYGAFLNDAFTITVLSGDVTATPIRADGTTNFYSDPPTNTIIIEATPGNPANYSSMDPDGIKHFLIITSASGTPEPYIVKIQNSSNPTVLPVELSSFTAVQSSENFVALTWVTQTATNMLGFHVYRNENNQFNSASKCTATVIPAINSAAAQDYTFTDNSVEFTTYYYWLEALDLDGSNTLFGPVSITLNRPAEPEGEDIDDVFTIEKLLPVYPNPFNPNVSISFNLAEESQVRVTIFNAKGQKVRDLYAGTKSQGNHVMTWDGTDNAGSSVTSGIYLFRLEDKKASYVKKGLLIK